MFQGRTVVDAGASEETTVDHTSQVETAPTTAGEGGAGGAGDHKGDNEQSKHTS